MSVADNNRRTKYMRTVRTKVYKFSELSEPAKKKAIEWYLSASDIDQFWYAEINEDAKNIGLQITDCDEYSIDGNFTLSANEVAANIFRDHGEETETYKTARKFMDEWEPVFAEYLQTEEMETELMDIETEFLKSLLEDYRIMANKADEYYHSPEYAIESIKANEYEFTKEGNIF